MARSFDGLVWSAAVIVEDQTTTNTGHRRITADDKRIPPPSRHGAIQNNLRQGTGTRLKTICFEQDNTAYGSSRPEMKVDRVAKFESSGGFGQKLQTHIDPFCSRKAMRAGDDRPAGKPATFSTSKIDRQSLSRFCLLNLLAMNL